ncbi:hypothetical protein G5B30_05020 [Sphingobacterium sp. SGG-5]|uniref:hypothetical protein n=1 Tax=Sphingobacterium sp. SGG-5 TaxID=2710881 RepID=UPI0013EAA9B3|nr:hypothetical protein [Sphingobacterium sp. SGG-5]NGM61277.1 hypothetical protein [Sphingobacterium sp. SGG-5]
MNNNFSIKGVLCYLCVFWTLSCGAHTPVLSDQDGISDEKREETVKKERGKLVKNEHTVNIYTDKGIELTFRHVERDYIPGKTSFYDIWQLWEAFGSKEDGSRAVRIVNPGEWETALKIGNDFVGGLNHGFERKTSVQFVVNDKVVSETEDLALQPFHSFYVIQESDLYAFNSTSDKIAHIIKKWDFKENGLIEFHQSITWLSAQSLSNSYMTMMPVARDQDGINITSKAKRDDIDAVFDVSQEGHSNPLGPSGRHKESSSMTLWGDQYKFSVTVERKNILPNSSLWVSNSKLYNKVYFDYSGKYEVEKGEKFELLTRFEFSRSE